MPITNGETMTFLTESSDPAHKKMASDIAMVTSLTKIFNTSLSLVEEGNKSPAMFALALTEKGLATSEMAQTATGSKNLQAANFVLGQALKSASMIRLASLSSPGRMGAGAVVIVAEKIVMAAGFAEFNRCGVAVASLAATIAGGVVTGASGVGLVIAAIAITSDAFTLYGAYRSGC